MSNPTVFSWTPPTTNTDGTPIAAGEITGYSVGVRDVAAAGSVAGTYTSFDMAPATATSATIAGLVPALKVPGSYAAAVQAVGPVDSAWTAEVTFSLVAPTPSAPTGFTVA